jgi:hypothetical protein
MILDLIVSKNLARRDHTSGERAFLAMSYQRRYAEAIRAQEGERKSRQAEAKHYTDSDDPTTEKAPTRADRHESGYERRASSKAAKLTGASGRGVARAASIARDAPDLAEKVRNGELALESSLWPLCAPLTRGSPGGHVDPSGAPGGAVWLICGYPNSRRASLPVALP